MNLGLNININRGIRINSTNQIKSTEKLSSGNRINRSADDAAGLAISEKMRGQIRGLRQAERNIQDGSNLLQVMDGAMSEVSSMILRCRELTVQALNDTNTSEDRSKIQVEINQLIAEIGAISNNTEFNGISLLNISAGFDPNADPADGLYLDSNYVTDRTDHIAGSDYVPFIVTTAQGEIPLDELVTLGTVEVQEGAYVFLFAFNMFTSDPDHRTTVILTAPDGTIFNVNDTNPAGKIVDTHLTEGGTAYISYGHNATDITTGFMLEGITSYGAGTWTFQVETNGGGSFHLAVTKGVSTDVESGDNKLWIQSGANGEQGMYLDLYDTRPSSLGIAGISVTSSSSANNALNALDFALDKMNSYRASSGAQQNRLGHTLESAGVAYLNLSNAESRIRDADMAKEMMSLTKVNILNQAATTMLAQANQSSDQVLKLLA